MNLLTEPRITVGEMVDKIIYRKDNRFEKVEIAFLIAIKNYYGEIPYVPLGSMDKDLVEYLEKGKKN